ncbi:MAG: hypothetical protein JOZ83_11640 [Silvibacterium sp.]|nr:hypothetical protein [Silvibacterium sp.]
MPILALHKQLEADRNDVLPHFARAAALARLGSLDEASAAAKRDLRSIQVRHPPLS